MASKELTIISQNTPLFCTCNEDIQFNIKSCVVSDFFIQEKTDSDFLFYIILNGSCVINTGGKQYELNDRHFLTIPGKSDISIVSISDLFLCCALSINVRAKMQTKESFWSVVLNRLQNAELYQLNDNIKGIVSILKSDALQKKYDSECLSRIYLETLFGEITRVIAGESAHVPKTAEYGDARIDAAIGYINENISANITSSDVAKYVFLSEKQLKRIFSNAIGKSPTDYIKSCKYEHACKLLKESEFSVFEIAELTGFHDTKSFSEFFKRYSGYSPAKYRDMENK